MKLGITFESQKRIGKYNVDFFLPEINLVLECDGDYWHSRPEAIERDKKKDIWLMDSGYRIFRLKESEIRKGDLLKLKLDRLK